MNDKTSQNSKKIEYSNAIPLVLTACVIGIYMTLLVSSENFVFGSVPGNWAYRYFENVPTIPRWIPVLVIILLGIAIFIGSKLIHSHEKITLLSSFLIVLMIQILIRKVYPFSLEEIVLSSGANSFYAPAINYSAMDILSKFSELASTFPKHARTNMPGKILLYNLFTIFTSSPEVMGLLIMVLSSFGGLLLYGICKQLFHDKKAAFYALILYGLIPSKLFFFPILNTVTPVFILLSFYLFLLYIEKKQLLLAWLLGFSFYLLYLFEPSPLTTGIIFIGILTYAIFNGTFSIKDFLILGINLILAFVFMHILFYLIFSFDIFETFQYVLNDAVNFNQSRQRLYWLWIEENAKEFFFGIGVPVSVVLIFMAAQLFSQWKNLINIKNWTLDSVYLVSVLITYIVITFLGVNRGEITRLWIYLAVFFQVPVSRFIAKIPKGEIVFFLLAGVLTIQTILTLHRVEFVGL